MTLTPKLLARASVVLMLGAMVTATVHSPPGARVYLTVVAFGTAAFVIQSAVSEPRDLLVAALLCLAPVVSLVGEGSPGWLVAPLTVLILVGAELNALAWSSQGDEELDAVGRARLAGLPRLAVLGLGAALLVDLVGTLWTTGFALIFLLAVAALGGVGRLLFRVEAPHG